MGKSPRIAGFCIMRYNDKYPGWFFFGTDKGGDMQKDIFVLWAKYNKAANEKMDAIIKTLSPGEWDKNLGGYFKSVRGLCSHLYICDFNWLKRFSILREFTVLKEAFFNREPYSYTELLFEDMGEYLKKRPELDDKISSFAEELKDGDLNSLLKYTDSRGTIHEKIFGGLVMQSLNHDTHHRGMISLYLEMLGRDNDFTSFGAIL
jgi:uncharacterized damage-inducible protein DinB